MPHIRQRFLNNANDGFCLGVQFDRMHLDNEQWATLIGWPDNDDLIGPCVP